MPVRVALSALLALLLAAAGIIAPSPGGARSAGTVDPGVTARNVHVGTNRVTPLAGGRAALLSAGRLVAYARKKSAPSSYLWHQAADHPEPIGSVIGQQSGETALATTDDGRRIVLWDWRRLSRADTDGKFSLYLKRGGRYRLLATPSELLDHPFSTRPQLYGGRRLVIHTAAPLAPGDTDGAQDVFSLDIETGLASPLTPGVDGDGEWHPTRDGVAVVGLTRTPLTPADTNGDLDIASGSPQGTVAFNPATIGAESRIHGLHVTPDRSAVAFSTEDSLTPGDTDDRWDLYAASPGNVRLLTPGTSLGAGLEWLSADGGDAIFSATEALAPDDEDTQPDLYLMEAGATEPVLITPGGTDAEGAANVLFADATQAAPPIVFFATPEALLPSDSDTAWDLYSVSDGHLELLSDREGGPDAEIDAAVCTRLSGIRCLQDERIAQTSSDGSVVIFQTSEPLVTEDADRTLDIYRRSPTGLELVSTSPDRSGEHVNTTPPFFCGLHTTEACVRVDSPTVAGDGRRIFFSSGERLAGGDCLRKSTRLYRWAEGDGLTVVNRPSDATCRLRGRDYPAIRDPKKTTGIHPLFHFSVPEPWVDFECRVDDYDWYACDSPERLGNAYGLSQGGHTFRIRLVLEGTPEPRQYDQDHFRVLGP